MTPSIIGNHVQKNEYGYAQGDGGRVPTNNNGHVQPEKDDDGSFDSDSEERLPPESFDLKDRDIGSDGEDPTVFDHGVGE